MSIRPRLSYGDLSVERGELGVTEDGSLDLGGFDLGMDIAGAIRIDKQVMPNRGEDVPVALQGINVPHGDAAAQVAVDVLQVFRLSTVDVARQVQVEVVGLDLGQRHHAGILGRFQLPGEGIHDAVDVLRA